MRVSSTLGASPGKASCVRSSSSGSGTEDRILTRSSGGRRSHGNLPGGSGSLAPGIWWGGDSGRVREVTRVDVASTTRARPDESALT